MNELGTFPFGNPVKKVEQKDRTPKRVFVLGTYSNAVNVRWFTPNEKTYIMGLAIDNEPDIFWRGSPAYVNRLVNYLKVPQELGKLVPAPKELNGATGRALDYNLLEPLGLSRKQTWLCYLIPFTLANKSQRKSVKKYLRFKDQYNLPAPYVKPDIIKAKIIDRERVEEIVNEIYESKAELIITLGDLPLRHFVKHFNVELVSLSSFEKYGQIQNIKIGNNELLLLSVVHPRQAGRKGKYSRRWYCLHDHWIEEKAEGVLKDFVL